MTEKEYQSILKAIDALFDLDYKSKTLPKEIGFIFKMLIDIVETNELKSLGDPLNR